MAIKKNNFRLMKKRQKIIYACTNPSRRVTKILEGEQKKENGLRKRMKYC